MTNGFETPADIPFCLEPGSWVTGPSLIERLLADIDLRRRLAEVCESPIEIDLAAALIPLLYADLTLLPQFKLERFRYDFAALNADRNPILLIECDSKEFHSSPEQKANDRAKDKAAATANIRLERVTGGEIFHASKGVAQRLFAIIETLE